MIEEIKDTEEKGSIKGDYKVGNKKPPIEGQIKPGEIRNPKGRGKEIPNRSTIARKVLKMVAEPPEKIINSLRALHPKLFEDGKEKKTIELLMNLRMTMNAIVKGDVSAYNAVMDSAYGKKTDITSGGKPIQGNVITFEGFDETDSQ